MVRMTINHRQLVRHICMLSSSLQV